MLLQTTFTQFILDLPKCWGAVRVFSWKNYTIQSYCEANYQGTEPVEDNKLKIFCF
jgi:hypothetical protein